MTNCNNMHGLKLKNNEIGDNNPVFIIGEMAWSHDGYVENAKKIIRAIADAGGDAISMHLTSLENYMTKNYRASSGQAISAGKTGPSIYEYLSEINPSDKDWKEIFRYAKDCDLVTCVMCNDLHSLKFSDQLDVDMHVIASSCFVEEELVSNIAKRKKPVILRIGGATIEEIEKVMNLIKETGTDQIALLHGIQTYPTKIEETNLRLIPTLKQLFSIPVGIADHVDAESEFALVVPQLAIALDANLVEKHITHDRSKKGEDFESALNPDEFKTLVKHVRLTEKALGSSHIKHLSQAEIKYRGVVRKKTVAKADIKKHQIIKKDMIMFKRSDEGASPDESKRIIGRIAKCNIKKDEGVTLDNVV